VAEASATIDSRAERGDSAMDLQPRSDAASSERNAKVLSEGEPAAEAGTEETPEQKLAHKLVTNAMKQAIANLGKDQHTQSVMTSTATQFESRIVRELVSKVLANVVRRGIADGAAGQRA